MANYRREGLSYRPFRTEPVLAEGLLAVARPGGEFMERVAAGMFRIAAEAGAVAKADQTRRGTLAGQRAALDNRPQSGVVPAVESAGEPAGKPLPADRAARAAEMKAYLVSKHGVSNEFAAGLLGNFSQESSFNTKAINRGDGNDGSDSIGLGQWNGKRARGLRDFAASRGRAVDDWQTQLDFAMHELETTEKVAGNRLRAARTVEEATAAAIGFERPQGWTPNNPAGGHGWANRLAAARSIHGSAVAAAGGGNTRPPAPPAAAPAAPSFRPSGQNTAFGRAYDEAGTKTYVQMLEAQMRDTTDQIYERYKDDPAGLEQALDANRKVMLGADVFPEIEADFEIGYGSLARGYLSKARDNLARKVEEQDRADFQERTRALETDRERRLAGFDPDDPAAEDGIASVQAATDAHYDDAVRRGILDADDAAAAKARSRNETALAFYQKQAEAKDAAGVEAMLADMEKDFADGGLPGIDAEGWQSLSSGLQKMIRTKQADSERLRRDFAERGDKMAARIVAGFEVPAADLSQLMLDAGRTPDGKAALEEAMGKIATARSIRDKPLAEGEKLVKDMRTEIGKTPTDAQLRRLLFAEQAVEAKRKAILTDQVSYAEAQGLAPATPSLVEAKTPEDMIAILNTRTGAAQEAAKQLGVSPRYLKAGEAAAIARMVKAQPDQGAAIAAAIVSGSGASAPAVLAEFGTDAPLITEAGAILAFGGSGQAASDVIRGYQKTEDDKTRKGMKAAAERSSFATVTGGALALAPQDAARIGRAAASITRARISDEGIEPDSDEAAEIHRRAVHEAAGAVFDRGEQWGGFTEPASGFSVGALGQGFTYKVLVPSDIRADLFDDVVRSIGDDDLSGLAIKPKQGVGGFWSARALSAAETLRRATPVAVKGGYAFALGDPASDDPQFVQGENGSVFVLDVLALKDRLGPRVPGAFR